MVYFVGIVVWGIIWGIVCERVIENKGYDSKGWFWWGFFFSFIAVIVAATKPEAKQYSYDMNGTSFYPRSEQNKYVNTNEWKCKCGRINLNYIGTCACGRTKSNQNDPITAKEVIINGFTGEWTCSCGKVNAGYVGTCSCGRTKSGLIEAAQKSLDYQKETDAEKLTDSIKENEMANIELIQKYKKLLDEGAITEEEYAKKKEKLLML